MKKIVFALSVALAQFAQAEVPYPHQSDIPTLNCKYNGATFTLAASKMIWEKAANANWPDYNGYSGTSESVVKDRFGTEMKFTVSYRDNTIYGRNIEFVTTTTENSHWNYISYEVESFTAIKKFKITLTTIADANTEIYFVECKTAP